jgi:hypothetical protein
VLSYYAANKVELFAKAQIALTLAIPVAKIILQET